MGKHINTQMQLADALIHETHNRFLQALNALIHWLAIGRELEAIYTSKVGRLPYPPQVCFKMLVLQHFYNLSDLMCEEWVSDRISWRRLSNLPIARPITYLKFFLGIDWWRRVR